MRQSLARFSGPESSPQIRSLADFIVTTAEFKFSVHTGLKGADRVTGGEWTTRASGAPLLLGAMAAIDCEADQPGSPPQPRKPSGWHCNTSI
jgi:hypothetical protein